MGTKLNPRKLLFSKWTAVQPENKEKHFLVVRVFESEDTKIPITELEVELEAVYSRRSRIIPWIRLTDTDYWRQGWH